jgi:hypothetical protein
VLIEFNKRNAAMTMIIQLDRYRKVASHYADAAFESRVFGNTAPKLSLREIQGEGRRSAGPSLPDNFDNFNAGEFIGEVYALATQI